MSVTWIAREQWATRARGWTTKLVPSDVTGVALHWPGVEDVASYHGLTQDQIIDVIRGFESFHVTGRGWPGIGYCILVDWAGRVYEGAGLYKAAHSGTGYEPNPNGWLVGIQLINGMEDEPTEAQIDAVNTVIDELKADGYRIALIYGHQTVPLATTTCPGGAIMELIEAGVFGTPAKRGGPTTMAGMISPFGGRVTAEYMGYPGHAGIDIAPPIPQTVGGEVFAPFDGIAHKVVRWSTPGNKTSTWAPGRTGNGFLLETPGDGMGYGFNHMKPVGGIEEGTRIRQGQLIGHLDRSGNMTGPHLHFERWKSWRDPSSHTNPRIDFTYFGIAPGSTPKIASTPSTPPTTTAQAWVKAAQGYLKDMGYYLGKLDGIPGPMFTGAVRDFQRSFGLYEDGQWGKVTDGKVHEVLSYKTPSLLVDGVEGKMTVVAEQWAWRATGHYEGWIDGVRGELVVRSEQQFLTDCGYDAGPADGVFGERSVKAEQTWLKHTTKTYTYGVDGVRGKDSVKGLQRALNSQLVKLHTYNEPTAPAPKPTPVPKPTPQPEPTPPPTEEDKVIDELDPSEYPSLQEFADAVADELARRLSRKD